MNTRLAAVVPLLLASGACSSPEEMMMTTMTPDAGPPAAEPGCPEPKGPTVHPAATLSEDQTWTAAGSPHIVQGSITVRDGRKLTIEPCAVVRLADKAGLQIGFSAVNAPSTLEAEGTSGKPIRFEGLDGARWGAISVVHPATARLAHVTLEGGGKGSLSGATLIAQGDNAPPSKRGLLVDNVTVKDSYGAGVKLWRTFAFADGSRALTVVGSGSGDAAHPAPLEIDEHAIGTVPQGRYDGNRSDEIWVDPEHYLGESATMRALGVRWRIGAEERDSLVVGLGRDTPLATLTIEAGVTVAFAGGTALEIEHGGGAFPASGALLAMGTAEAPIVFTSARPTPAPGDWRGLWFGGVAQPDNRLQGVRIEYTGAPCGCVLVTCSAGVTSSAGAVTFTQPPPGVFITDSTVANAAANGFVLGYEGPLVDFAAQNRTENVAGCPMTLPRDRTCPQPLPACK